LRRFAKREQQGVFAFGQQNWRAFRIDEATGATFKQAAVKPVPPLFQSRARAEWPAPAFAFDAIVSAFCRLKP
jgi:hypothetical protein